MKDAETMAYINLFAVLGALEELCARVHAEPVQCIGRRFVMYRESRQNRRIEL